MASSNLTAARLRELLSYDPDTGLFVWRVRAGRVSPGQIASSIDAEGYRIVKVDGEKHYQHRLVWFYVNGVWPVNLIDHRDGVRLNNRIANLRDVTNRTNLENQRTAQRNNKCGLLGVSFRMGVPRARIRIAGKNIYLGSFETPELAHAAYLEAKRQSHQGCTI